MIPFFKFHICEGFIALVHYCWPPHVVLYQYDIFFYLYIWQLGLAEKNVFSYDFDMVVSDPSDPNTNSFSDDTEDKSQKSADPEMVCYFILFF